MTPAPAPGHRRTVWKYRSRQDAVHWSSANSSFLPNNPCGRRAMIPTMRAPTMTSRTDADRQGAADEQSQRAALRRLQKRERWEIEETCPRKQKTEDDGAKGSTD